jgi:hypothetical protein
MTPITPEQKAAYKEARQAALDAVAKLNGLFVETARPLRAVFRIEREPEPWVDDEQDDDDQRSGIGREGAEREDEGDL